MAKPRGWPKGKPRKVKEDTEGIVQVPQAPMQAPTVKSEKEQLLELYQFMKSRGINSIGNLENMIARAE